jgi:ABC-type glycerol-3-phosphate transport system permease component
MIPGIVIYLALAALVGYIGRDRKFGFWGYFFCAVLFTPLVSLVMVFASNKRTAVAL